MSHVYNYSLSNGTFNYFPYIILLIIHIHNNLKPGTDTALKIFARCTGQKFNITLVECHIKIFFSKTKFMEERK